MKIHTIFATALTVALSVSSCSKQSGEVFTLTSPDGKLELSVQKILRAFGNIRLLETRKN